MSALEIDRSNPTPAHPMVRKAIFGKLSDKKVSIDKIGSNCVIFATKNGADRSEWKLDRSEWKLDCIELDGLANVTTESSSNLRAIRSF
jgi:hypothetical protein